MAARTCGPDCATCAIAEASSAHSWAELGAALQDGDIDADYTGEGNVVRGIMVAALISVPVYLLAATLAWIIMGRG